MGNELNSDIVLGLVILIITLLLALPRFQQVELVLELISEVVGTLVSIFVLLQRLIRGLHQIISMAHDGFQQVVSVLELIDDIVGSLVNFAVLLLQLIRICKTIWSICTVRQPLVANDHQNEVPLADINYGQNDIPLTDAEGDAANG
ncbi:hypothetical protein ACB092_05G012400 [Castanea dentata]